MDLFCAIDLRDGRAVRLLQGDFGKERSFGDPLELAERFVGDGATRLHVVDLDAARTGRPLNRRVVKAIIDRVTVPVQVGGGVRGEDDVAELRRRRPEARIETIEDAGHRVQGDKPVELARLLAGFLQPS